MKNEIKAVCVVGSGVMGTQIAAHFANIGIPTYLLDIVPSDVDGNGDRNRIAKANLNAALKTKPKVFYDNALSRLITCGNITDHLSWIQKCDWVIEAVTENLTIKRNLLDKICRHYQPGMIITTNTSGISINAMANALPEEIRPYFFGVHFFNPVRYMKLMEIIPSTHTDPKVVDFIATIGETHLGKGIVYAKDTPNFIANRIGVYGMLHTIHVMLTDNYTIEEVDTLTGPLIGRPKSASFRTADLVGLDTLLHVAQNVYDNAVDDEKRDTFLPPRLITQMIEQGWLGHKSGQGFYKKVGKDILTLDTTTTPMEYRPRQEPNLPALKKIKEIPRKRARIKALFYDDSRAGQFVFKTIAATLIYAANRVHEISDDLVNIDNAMRWGFNWEFGPFELWDLLGVAESIAKMAENGYTIPKWITEFVASGSPTFYKTVETTRSYYDVSSQSYTQIPDNPNILTLSSHRTNIVESNSGATLIDIGDDVICLEFHTKMNAIGDDIVSMIRKGVQYGESNFKGMVIANEGSNFSVGANIMLLLMEAQDENWEDIEDVVRDFQAANMLMKYAKIPIVAAPFGLTLGGGCEVVLHADRIRAAAETYMGLVEVGVGVIPAGGGTKEMLIRNLEHLPPNGDPFPFVRQAFETIGMAKVAESAEEARGFHFLQRGDQITVNKDFLIRDAKAEVLALHQAGYTPPRPQTDIVAIGQSGLSTFEMALYNMKEGRYISEYDYHIGKQLAKIVCGGSHVGTRRVSEHHLLDLECEAFLHLIGEEKTQLRMAHMLKTGKPLRN